jgi:YbgC/YbaW family acyl-CoA thioester hydrolase
MRWHEVQVTIRFNEADPWGIVWYPNYFAYVEEAKADLFSRFGLLPHQLTDMGFLAPVIKATCDYKSSARPHDRVTVRLTLRPQETACLVIRFEIVDSASRRLLVRGETTQVLLNAKGYLLYRLTGEVAERIGALAAHLTGPAEDADERVCVIIPAYNAAATLPELLESVLPLVPQVIVVDDGSTDATAQAARDFADRGVTLLGHERNLGKSAALGTGFGQAVRQGFTVAVTMDADLQHRAADLPGLLAVFRERRLDMLVGSRAGAKEGMPGSRRFGNWLSSWVSGLFCGLPVPDAQCGFRVFRLATCAPFLTSLESSRYVVESEMLLRAARLGLRIGFSPITVHYPASPSHKSYYRPWRDTARIVVYHARELLRRLWAKIRPAAAPPAFRGRR